MSAEGDLLEWLAEHSLRPRAFVYGAFPWGEVGTELEHRSGPEPWQDELLAYMEAKLLDGLTQPFQIISEAIQVAVKSGHDVGKTALVCWLVIWAISTREDTKGVVTANTEKQLRLKTWAELSKWHRLFLARHLFRVTATSIVAVDPDREREWRIDAIPWSEDNPEAFAGLHNFGKRVLVIFDEASGIVDKIWETIDGVMNERGTELIWCAFGNPTRNVGRFRECFDREGQGQFWHTITVDSRAVSFTNHARIDKQITLWGMESDYIKVRWLGEFPSSSITQLIPADSIRLAMQCEARAYHFEPLIMGVDVARNGAAESVITFRRGRDARSIPAIRVRIPDITRLGDLVATHINKHSPDAVFVDGGGVGGGLIDFLRRLGHSIIEVQFGGTPSIPLGGEVVNNKRTEMYCSVRQWLATGGAIENSRDLYDQLIAQEFTYSKVKGKQDALALTPKDEQDESPDWADALALTFAYPVSARAWKGGGTNVKVDYDPMAWAGDKQAESPNRSYREDWPLDKRAVH